MHIIKRFFVILCLIGLFFVSFNSQPVYAADNVVETNFFGNIQDDDEGCGMFMIANFVVDILSMGVVIAGVIGVTIAGTTYLTAKDSEEKTRKAKNRILEIVIGLVVYAVLYAGVQWLLPGGKINSSCKTLTSEQVTKTKNKEKEKKEKSNPSKKDEKVSGSGNSKLTGKTEYKKKINSKPFQLKVEGADKIKFKSSNKRVAWVTKDGVVYPNDVGTAYVTASAGGNELKIKIIVNERITKPILAEVPAGDVVKSKYKVGGKFYSYDYVFRYKNPEKAELAADNAIATVNNNKVVGHQGNNYSFTQEMAKSSVNWDPKRINKKVATACSQFVLTMAQSTGLHRSPLRWAQRDAPGAAKNLKDSSHFYTITDKKYTRDWRRLRRGDIMIDTTRTNGKGAHAVMVSN